MDLFQRFPNPHQASQAAVQGQTALRPLFWLAATLFCFAIAAPAQDIPSLPDTHAARGCTQEDAPALEIYLTPSLYDGTTDPTPPYIRFEISATPTETLTNLTLELQPLRLNPTRKPGRIARAEWATSLHDSTFLTGTLTLDHATPGGQIRGHFHIITPTGQTLTNTFQTPYPNKPSVCG